MVRRSPHHGIAGLLGTGGIGQHTSSPPVWRALAGILGAAAGHPPRLELGPCRSLAHAALDGWDISPLTEGGSLMEPVVPKA